MYYTSSISDPEHVIEQIIEAASKFNADRFLYAMRFKDWDEQKLKLKTEEVAFYRGKLEAEFERLVEFAKVFNKEFVTENNKCYSSALLLLRKLKSGISETKRLFMGFCPKAHRESIYHAIGNNPVSAFDYSNLSANAYQLDLFQFEGYPDCVNQLYNEMEQFFMVLIRSIQLCKQVLDDEKKIRNDNKYCKALFDEFKENLTGVLSNFFMLFQRDSEYLTEEANPAIASRNHYENDEAWASVGYHNYTKKEVQHLIVKQVLDEEEGSDLSRVEILLFGNDVQKVHKYRQIIRHFDELIPDSYHRQHLPAKYVQMFLRYVGIAKGHEKAAVEYFNQTYLSTEGHKFYTIAYQSVNACKQDVKEDLDGSYEEFENDVKNRFFATKSVTMVANF